MRQSGTMKVMWNVRLFKGMKLLPRQVSEGDRRMDVYVRMVLVDDGRPKSYAIKVSLHFFTGTDNSSETTRSWMNYTLQLKEQFRNESVTHAVYLVEGGKRWFLYIHEESSCNTRSKQQPNRLK